MWSLNTDFINRFFAYTIWIWTLGKTPLQVRICFYERICTHLLKVLCAFLSSCPKKMWGNFFPAQPIDLRTNWYMYISYTWYIVYIYLFIFSRSFVNFTCEHIKFMRLFLHSAQQRSIIFQFLCSILWFASAINSSSDLQIIPAQHFLCKMEPQQNPLRCEPKTIIVIIKIDMNGDRQRERWM